MQLQVILGVAVLAQELLFHLLEGQVLAFQLLDPLGDVGFVLQNHFAQTDGGQGKLLADVDDLGDLPGNFLHPLALYHTGPAAAVFQLPAGRFRGGCIGQWARSFQSNLGTLSPRRSSSSMS